MAPVLPLQTTLTSMQSYQQARMPLAAVQEQEGPAGPATRLCAGAASPEPTQARQLASQASKPKQAPRTHVSQNVAALYAEAAMRGVSPLTLAMQERGTQAVRAVLAAGACPNTPCDQGMLPLEAAIQLNRADVAQALVDGGASLYLPGEHGWPPLLAAAAQGRTEVLELLLAAGAPVDQRGSRCGCGCRRCGETPLIVAAEEGHLAAVQLLLRRGAEVDARDEVFHRTPLSYAAKEEHVAVMHALLQHGADVDARGAHGWSALMDACQEGRLQAVCLLIAHGASLDFACAACCTNCDRAGMTALMLTACAEGQGKEGQVAIATALADAGASLDVQDDSRGYTAAMWAASQGNLAVLGVLAEAGAGLEVVSRDGETVMQVAVRRMQEAMAEEAEEVAVYGAAVVLLLCKTEAVEGQTMHELADRGSPIEMKEAPAAAVATADSSAAPAEAPACPGSCAAPGCTNTGRLRRCGGCKTVRYCGEACRNAHWREHKAECKRLRAAAAGGSASQAAC